MMTKNKNPKSTSNHDVDWPTVQEMEKKAKCENKDAEMYALALAKGTGMGMGMSMPPGDDVCNGGLSRHLGSGADLISQHEWKITVYVTEFLLNTNWKDIATRALDAHYEKSIEKENVAAELAALHTLSADSEELGMRHPEILAEAIDYVGLYEEAGEFDVLTQPLTTLLVHIMVRIGWTVAQHYKEIYGRPRPHVLDPTLMPIIPVPAFPAYPSGHSTQVHLIGEMLQHLITTIADEADKNDKVETCIINKDALITRINYITCRIARNREWAGVHYQSDTDAGSGLASIVWAQILTNENFIALIDAAKDEWCNPIQSGRSFLIRRQPK